MVTPPSTPKDPIQVSTSEDEQHNWIMEMESEGIDIFDLLEFDFIPLGTKMVGEKIQDTPMSEALGEDWNQLPHLPQGPLRIPLPPLQDLANFDKRSLTPLPLVTQIEVEEQQTEEGEFQQLHADEVSKEGKIYIFPQDTKARSLNQQSAETPTEDIQCEKIPERSDMKNEPTQVHATHGHYINIVEEGGYV